MDVSVSVDGPAHFMSTADKGADKGGYNFRKRRNPTDADHRVLGPYIPKREKREGFFPVEGGLEKQQHKSPHKKRTPEAAREQDPDAAESKMVKATPEKSPSRRYQPAVANGAVEKVRQGTPQRQRSPLRRPEEQRPENPSRGGAEKARYGTPQKQRPESPPRGGVEKPQQGTPRKDERAKSPARQVGVMAPKGGLERPRQASPRKDEPAKSPAKHVGGPSAVMASINQGEGGGIVKDEVTLLKRQLKDEMNASRVLQKKLREFEEERAHDLMDLTRAMDTLKAKEYELEMYVNNHQKNRVNRQGQEQEVRSRSQELEGQLAAVNAECNALQDVLKQRSQQIDELRGELGQKKSEVQKLAAVVEKQAANFQEERSRLGAGWRALHEHIQKEVSALCTTHSDAILLDARETDADDSLADEIKATVQKLVSEHEELKRRFATESAARRKYYNEVLEMKGNIRVFCRCRPLSASEISSGQSNVVDFDVKGDNELCVKSGRDKKLFKFDRVFNPEADQAEVFADTSPVVMSVLDGFNVCIFAYGQTGTGKTFTMEGCPSSRGVNYRTLAELFKLAEERAGEARYDVTVSVLEVYNEQIRDLLISQSGAGQKKLEVRQGHQGNHVPGLTEQTVTSADQAWELLQHGSKNRSVGATNANEHSSRSHCMLSISVRGENKVTGETTRSRLWLVDLAGSERVGKSEASGDRLKEAQSINKSLAALGDVISALTTKSPHIPYRNSKLTHLLQDSLGGDSKALMFVQISPAESDAGESLCSLQFASRVRGIELGPAKRQVDGNELFKYKQLVASAKQEAKAREEALKQLQEGVRAVEGRLQIKDKLCATLSEKVRVKETREAELEAQLLAERRALMEARATAEAAQKELHSMRMAQNRASENVRSETGLREAPYSQERQGHWHVESAPDRPYQEPHSTSDRVTAAMAAAQAAIAERKALIETARLETSPLGKQNPKPLTASKPPRPETGVRETAGMSIGTSGIPTASELDASVSLGDWGRGDSRASVNSRPRLPTWAETPEFLQQGVQNDLGKPPPSASRAPRIVASRFTVAPSGPSIGTPLRIRHKPQGYGQTPGLEEERRGSLYRQNLLTATEGFPEERRGSVYRAPEQDLGDQRSGSQAVQVAQKQQNEPYDASRAPLAGLKPNRIDVPVGLPPPSVVDTKVRGARTALSKAPSSMIGNGAQRVRSGTQTRKQFIVTQAAAIAAQQNKPVEMVLREKLWQ